MNDERWALIPGYGDRYEASSTGLVRSWATSGKSARLSAEPKIRKPVASRKRGGYLCVMMSTRGEKVRLRPVHSLVLEAFVGPRPTGMVCRHINGNPLDNRIDNLAWGTQDENMADAVAHGTATIGSKNARAKFTDEQVREIRQRLAGGMGTMEAAALYGTAGATISRMKKGLTYAGV